MIYTRYRGKVLKTESPVHLLLISTVRFGNKSSDLGYNMRSSRFPKLATLLLSSLDDPFSLSSFVFFSFFESISSFNT